MTSYSATYSPEDNKLRLYASTRLDAETYGRVKAAGFKWAPKQNLFFAPAWSPNREDLLLELAGEIDDEDKSLVERAWYGSHHHYSRKYMHLYIAEACYKFNARKSPDDFGTALAAMVGA